ncbi:MAG: hypothetical protein K2I03_12855 [Lachnospiraceae bacterium]|nr:hypothetical protein [Lachnospiraceae bacterium]MDE6253741.1 hypothetical protein [Lachnospiraceae bacterium]
MMEQREIEKINLDRMRKKLEEDKRKFQVEKEIFKKNSKRLSDNLEKKKRIFETQWKLLEGELLKLAAEKERLQKEKEFFREVHNFEKRTERESSVLPIPKMFFAGVKSEESLKKRYKELMKIYHPDNPAGDSDIVLMINREYNKMKELYTKK